MSGDAGNAEGHAFRERVRARPDEPERAEAAPVPLVEIRQVRRERLGALEVQDRRHATGPEVVGGTRERQAEPLRHSGQLERDTARLGPLERRGSGSA